MPERPAIRHLHVKICGITRVEDGLAAEAAGADAIGLIFAAGSRRRVSLARARELAAALGPYTTRVGVFTDAPTDEILETVEALRLDVVQVHGEATPERLRRLRERARVVRALRFEPGVTPASAGADEVDGVLLDGPRPGSGRSFDWRAAAEWRGHRRLVLAGGLRPETVAEAVASLAPYGVDVASGVESAPGVKDPAAVGAFVRAARAAARDLASRSAARSELEAT